MESELEIKYLEVLRKPVKSENEVKEKERLKLLLTEELSREIRGLSEELIAIGSNFSDPWDMVNTKASYPEAIDILVKHIPKNYHDKNKEGIFRALTVKEAKGKANVSLIAEYNKIPKEKDNLRWVIGNAIYVIITKDDIESIFQIVLNKKNGMSRSRFVSALAKVKSEKVEQVLIKLLDDEEMTFYALQSLGKMKSKKAKEKINLLTHNSNASIREEAIKALKKIE